MSDKKKFRGYKNNYNEKWKINNSHPQDDNIHEEKMYWIKLSFNEELYGMYLLWII
jgi:hypothetical protein